MAHDASNNNPAKETVHAIIGIVVLLAIISSIAISAWLRPAGNHEPATTPATEKGKILAEKLQAIDAPAAEESPANNAEAVATDDTKAEEDNKAEDKAEETKTEDASSQAADAADKADNQTENQAEATAEQPKEATN